MNLNPERLRAYQLQRSAHKMKNRSSKHLRRINCKPVYRCMSGSMLSELSYNGNFDAQYEIARRERRFENTRARKARYAEKLEKKRTSEANA